MLKEICKFTICVNLADQLFLLSFFFCQQELIGPYWSLRAAFGPLLETFLLLDRLLFLQEQGSSIEAVMLPIFNAALSPRNVAIIAKKLTQM